MHSRSRLWLSALAASAALLAGCTGSHKHAPLPGPITTSPPHHLSADTPLAPCVDPAPATPKPLDAPLAQDFADGRVRTTVSLDNGPFRADPAPHDATTGVSAALAMCTMLASANPDGYHVFDAAVAHGMSFGLGVVTVSLPIVPGPGLLATGPPRNASVQPFVARLAWIGVITPDESASCPAMTAPITFSPTPHAAHFDYDVLVIDAATGADGMIYRNAWRGPCSDLVDVPPTAAPLLEFLSLPWTLVARGPGRHSATLSSPLRPCDQPNSMPKTVAAGGADGEPVVNVASNKPGLVIVSLERVLTTCGPAVPTKLLLDSSTPTTDLPQHLVHGPIGALDVSGIPGN